MKKMLRCMLLALLLIGPFMAHSQIRPFVTTWTTTTSPETISIPLNGGFTYDFTFVWKNAADSSIVTSGSHTSADGAFATDLPTAGSYLLEITGNFPHLQRGYPIAVLTDVNQWGDISWRSFNQTFRNWTGVSFSATDVPDLSNTSTTFQMFFDARSFNSDVSTWDVSNVQNMGDMFRGARAFNSDISGWDISNAASISQMFAGAQNFNADLSGWVINENVTNLSGMFRGAFRFTSDLSGWEVSNITNMREMFRDAQNFNSDLNRWNVSNVTNMLGMFRDARLFNGDISTWNVGIVTNMRDMFLNASVFNGNLNQWNVENVTDMQGMFANALIFNSDLNNWNVGKVRSMRAMFRNARAFNGNITNWNVGSVTNMGDMFRETRNFNQDIGNWDVSNVTTMAVMFRGTNAGTPSVFDQDISEWDVRKVTNMSDMFLDSRFNQDISSWVLESITNMRRMFFRAQDFNQNLGVWDIRQVTNMDQMFNGSGLTPQNYDQTLIGWAPQVDDTTPDIALGASGLTFCKSATARQSLIDNGWTINDSGNQVCLDEIDFVSFKIPALQTTEEVINTVDHTVTLSVIVSADIADLAPIFELSPGATTIPASSTSQDFTNPVTYTVTAEDGIATQDWIVTVSQETIALTGTDILTFELTEDSPGLEQVVSIDLDEVNQSIALNLIPFGSLTNITPELSISQGATLNPLSGTSIDLSTGSFTYTVTAEDGTTTQDWVVNTNVLPSEETDITAFTIPGQIGETEINSSLHEITVKYPFVLGIDDLSPVIEVSREATIDPISGITRDFTLSGTNSVEYTVTAQDAVTTQVWTITLIPARDETDITSFDLDEESAEADLVVDVTINTVDHTVTLTLKPFSEPNSIIATTELSPGATISPADGEGIDINSGSATYTVTAEDGITTQEWTVNTDVLLSTEADILSFELPGQVGEAFIDDNNFSIIVFFSSDRDLTSLTPSFEASRAATVSPTTGEAQNFSSDIVYTVTAQDGVTTQDWTVSAVIQRPFITSWNSSGGDLTISINESENYDFNYIWRNSNRQIVAFGRHNSEEDFITDLPAGEFTLEITGTFPHFTGYPKDQLLDVNQWGDIIWLSMRESFRNWTGTDFSATDTPDLSQAPNMFRAFSDNPNFNADLGDWDMSQIRTLQGLFNTCPSFNSDISQWNVSNVINMESTFVRSGFNGDISEWNVSNVTRMVNTFRDATNFDQDISGWDFSNVSNMSNMLSNSGMSVQHYDKFLISLATQDIRNNVTLGASGLNSCLSSNAKDQLIDLNDWTIQDNGQQCSSKTDIVAFDIPDSQIGDAVIDTANHTVLSIVLNSTDLSTLAPAITTSADATLIPASGVVQDFTNPVVYEVIASDSTSQTWTVTATNSEDASDGTDILTFNSGSSEVVETTIDTASHEITLRLIAGGNLTSITPEITVSLGATVSPASGETIDLTTGSATYTVTAEDQITSQDWTVSVILNNETDISAFDLTGVLSITKIDDEAHTIDLLVAEGTDITPLLTDITITEGASISPAAITVQDFTTPVTYTVTAEDGVTTQEWVVSVQLVRPFITRWQPENDEDEEDESSLFIGLDSDFDYNFSYQWKDENGVVIESGSLTTDDEELFSTFPNENEFTLEIIGDFPYLTDYFKPTLLDVLQWGDIEWRSFESTFRNWPGEVFSAEDTPDLSQVTSMRTMFRQASSFNGDVSDWDVSNVTDIAGVFNEASSFAGDVSQWQVDNVTDMQGAFNGTLFNGDLSNWNVGNVTNMINMFLNASLFDQDLSSWNIGQVTSMDGILSGSGMSTQNYDKFLISMATQTVQPNVTFAAAGIGHCFGASAMTQLETDSGWTINDGGTICSAENDILAIDILGLKVGDEIIDVVAHTAEVTVINSAPLTTLSPEFTLSDGAIFSATSPQSGQETDFSLSETNPVAYEVLSSDSTFQTWTVTVVNAATPATETDILTFVPGTGDNVVIDADTHEISFDAVITPELILSPQLTLSQGATSSPASGDEVDFTDGTETYTVTAEDGITTQNWTVTVNDLTPINDLCGNAIEVFVNDVVTGSSNFATSDASIAADCGSNNTGNGVWYSLIGNGETITLSTCSPNSFSDTSLSVFTGSCEDGLDCFAGNEDAGIQGECGGAGFQARLNFNSELGVEYLILVDGFGNATGGFELTITSEPTPELPTNDDCETAENLTVFAEGTGTPTNGNNTSAAVFSGEVNCDIFGSINDVWYNFNSGPNVRVGITLTGVDTDDDGPLNAASSFKLAAYEECGGNSIICDSNADGLTNLDVTPNTDYLLQVWNDDIEDEGTFTIIVNDGPNTPAILSFEDAGIGTASISRSIGNGTVIDLLRTNDPQNHPQITSLIGGNEEGIFAYDDITRQITIVDASALQTSATTAFDLTFRSVDQGPGELTSEITLTVNILDNTAPVFNVTVFSVNENTANNSVIGTLSVSDPDGDVVNIVSFSSSNGAISVNPLTRDLTVADASAFDFETNDSLSLQVTIEDVATASLQTTETITVNIIDVNEAPAVNTANFIISDQSIVNTFVGNVTFEDQDTNQSHSYSITDSDASDIFTIDTNTGEISILNAALLADNGAGVYNLTVEVSDNGNPSLSGSSTVTIEATTNNAPVISTNTLSVNENSPAGTLIGTIEVNDPDDDQITLTLANNSSLADFLLTQDGQLFVRDGAILDFESTPEIELEVAATDDGPGNLQTLKTIIIELNNVNETLQLADADFEISSIFENGAIVGTLEVTDPDSDTFSFAITTGNNEGIFAINEISGEISLVNRDLLNPAITSQYNLTVTASDGEFTDEAQVTIGVFANPDVPQFVSGNGFNINENAAGLSLIATVIAEDSDGISRYRIASGNDDNLFTIGRNSGELRLAEEATIDFEQTQQFILEVSAADDGLGNIQSIQQITININDVNEFNPVISNATGSVAENSITGSSVVMVEATDDDIFQTLSYEITGGNEAGLFAIDANGEISTTTLVDFETNESFNLTVAVSDDVAPARTATAQIAISVTDVNETPVLEAIGNQNGSVGTEITFTAGATDPENDELTFGFSGGTQIDGTTIDAATGEFAWTPSETQFGAFETAIEVTDGEFTASETITLTVLNSATDILTFNLTEQTGDATISETDHTVAIEVVLGTDVSSLVPSFTISNEASSSIESGSAIDFTDPVTITVTAQDGSTQDWTIIVNEAPGNETDILTFVLVEQTGAAIIDAVTHTVEIEVAFETNLSSLTPTFTLSEGASSNPASGAIINFSNSDTNPVTITVTAEDGSTTQDWTVTVTEDGADPDTDTDILTFVLAEQTGDATINTTNHTVEVEVATGTDISNLTPTLTLSEGATSNPANGETVDFTGSESNSVIYTVTAEDGITTQDWTVTVSIFGELNTENDILTFIVAGQASDAVIDSENHTVKVEVATGTDISNLAPTLTLSAGASSNPVSGETVDFTGSESNSVIYTVTAEDGITTQDWTVTVSIFGELNTENDILTFIVAGQASDAVIDSENHTVKVEVATGTDISNLAPTLTLSEGASSNPESGVAIDFSNAVTYTVTAEDGSIQDWRVTIVEEELPTSVSEEIKLEVFPNPATDVLTIKAIKEISVSMYDLNGRQVIAEQKGNNIRIDLTDLANGTFLLILKQDNHLIREKIIKH